MKDLGTKIYTDDPNLPYKTTKCAALYTRMEIDGVLAKWGVKKSGWSWEPEINQIYITFEYEETIEGQTVHPVIRVEAPVIWSHKTRNKAEEVNWNISLRVMYWFIKTHLEAAYLWHSSKTVAFLPYIATGRELHETLAYKVLGNLDKVQALPSPLQQPDRNKVIDA